MPRLHSACEIGFPKAASGNYDFNTAAVDLGVSEMTAREAAAAGAKTLVIGIAPPGGQLPLHWHPTLIDALEAGLDIAAGLHQRIADLPEIAAHAARLGRRIHDVRQSTVAFAIGSGARRSGRRLLTVGTDCALGKKYTALAIAQSMAARGDALIFAPRGKPAS